MHIYLVLIWIYQFNDYESFKFNGEFMINTNDGYVFAEGARDILAGFHQLNDRSGINTFIAKITAFIVTITPFKLNTVILYLPIVFSSFIVLPILLIARELKVEYIGFIAALIGSITWSYYNRTMIGYYDTDMLNVVFPLMIIWILIKAVKTNNNLFLIYLGTFLSLYEYWYLKKRHKIN